MSFTALTAVLGVSIGVAALVIVLSVMNGFSGMIWDRLLGIEPHITVRKAYNEQIENHGSLLEVLELHPDVMGASPFVKSEGFAFRRLPRSGVVSSGVIVLGIDSKGFLRTSEITDYFWAGTMNLRFLEGEDGKKLHR